MVLFGCRSLTSSDRMCEMLPARQQNLCKTSEGEPLFGFKRVTSFQDLLLGQCQQETGAMGKEVSGKDVEVEHRIFGQSIEGYEFNT